MALRNRPEGYGVVTKTLHWATVAALVAQVVVGLTMDWDDDSGRGRGRGRGRGGESGRGRGRDGDDAGWGLPDLGDEPQVAVHVVLGLTLLALALARWGWRRLDSLPAWAPVLSERDKRLAHWTERVLLSMLVVVPGTGLVLIASRDDDLLPLHVGAQLVLLAAVVTHVSFVLRRRLHPRMLPGGGLTAHEERSALRG